jgi:hypothetical protein
LTREEELKGKNAELERLAAAHKKTLEELKLSKEMLRRHEGSNSEQELDPEKILKERRKFAFSLKCLVEQLDLEIDQAYMPAMGKAVSAKFSEMYPACETFSRKKTIFFYEKDKECLEKIFKEEYLKYVLRKAEHDLNQ